MLPAHLRKTRKGLLHVHSDNFQKTAAEVGSIDNGDPQKIWDDGLFKTAEVGNFPYQMLVCA
jgi:hypothetical protein